MAYRKGRRPAVGKSGNITVTAEELVLLARLAGF